MRIAIVNDTHLIAEALRRHVMQEHEVIWVAYSGLQALQFCADNRPDLILMDLVMPEMDGVETTRLIMQSAPCAILIVTASPEQRTGQIFRALGAGALDVTATPVISGSTSNTADNCLLLKKIKTIGRLISAPPARPPAPAPALPSAAQGGYGCTQAKVLVAIGASTGGPVALAKLLSIWTPPADCALVLVQHIDLAFTDSFAHWLSAQINFPIEVIENSAPVTPGKIFMAKTNDHLLLNERQCFSYSPEPVDYSYRPSVDVFFHGIARYWRRKAIGVLLTGMGRDGAQGLLAMRKAGKLTIAQNQASSAVYGMPRAAADIHAAEKILSLEDIGLTLAQHTSPKVPQ